jgi:hypothetical protein
MKAKGRMLILTGILGIATVLIYKSIRSTLLLIGPKSFIVFIICGILIIAGIRLLVISKN